MLISVIIPLYNKAAYIEATLNSVLAQTHTDFEVLVIDDGSTDEGPGVVRTMAQQDARIRLVHQANAGVSAARNRGISEAQGEWVAFLDADDWWHPTYLAQQAKAMSAYPMVDMIATQLRMLPDAPNWNPLPWPAMADDPAIALIGDLPQRWMQGIPFFTSSVAVRRTKLLAMQPCFAVGESQGEDLDLWFRIAEQSDIAHSLNALVAYRTAAVGGLTSKHPSLVLAPYLRRMHARAQEGVLRGDKRRAALNFVAQQMITLSREALIQGQRLDGVRWLWQARWALFTKRWVVTCAMCLLVPAAVIARWEQWRIARTVPV
jgi:glycosyltransferase involved in cell wall biosynthesis